VNRVGAALRHAAHLVRRFAGSLSRRPPCAADETWAEGPLLAAEWELWRRMSNADRRHAILVARRLSAALGSDATRPVIAAALLHDVGKAAAGLGTFARVLATLVPGPLRRGRVATYHEHEAIGARWCRDAGSDPLTVALIAGDGPPALAAALTAADDV
jgi:hypothetical protein